MADHDKPGISDTYVNVLADLDARMEDQAKGFDPATTTPTNLKTGSVRWSSASKKWQLWSGSAWVDLAAEYAINVSGAAAKLKTERNFSLTGGATAAAVGFDGTGNVALNVTALDGTKVSAATTLAKGAVTLADSTAITSGTPGRIVDAAQLKVVKDSIPPAQVQSDWNASSGVAAIANKPTLGTMAAEAKTDYVEVAGDALTGGFTGPASVDDGTKSSGTYTPDPTTGNWRKIASNGTYTIAAPTVSGCYSMTIDITNGASANTVSFSGFVTGYPKGDALTNTSGNKFKLHISKSDIGVTAFIEALQ